MKRKENLNNMNNKKSLYADAIDKLTERIENENLPFSTVKKEFFNACDLIPLDVYPNAYQFKHMVKEKYGERLEEDDYLAHKLIQIINNDRRKI